MFSIIVPAYNEEKYIVNCLKSVLNLKKPLDYEIIVVNNASTDRTPEIVKNTFPEAKLINEPQKGLTRAYNRGAKEAKGEILVFLDADTILPPDRLEKVLNEFKKDPKLVALSGPPIYKDGGFYPKFILLLGVLFLAMPGEIIFNRILKLGAGVNSGNLAVKKEAFEKIGGFDEKIFYSLDADFARRVSKLGKVRYRFCLSVESSARRLKKEGAIRMLIRYILNNVWPHLFKKPFTKDYIDVR